MPVLHTSRACAHCLTRVLRFGTCCAAVNEREALTAQSFVQLKWPTISTLFFTRIHTYVMFFSTAQLRNPCSSDTARRFTKIRVSRLCAYPRPARQTRESHLIRNQRCGARRSWHQNSDCCAGANARCARRSSLLFDRSSVTAGITKSVASSAARCCGFSPSLAQVLRKR